MKFPTTNNKAEYEGILTGLRLGKALGATNLLIQSDSKLVVGQLKGDYLQDILLKNLTRWNSSRSPRART